MKRRTVECGKMRRPAKRSKIGEGFFASTTFVYMKFLSVWAFVLLADFILEFRFEYLWPFWLLIRSVYDSFKYQGLAFSMFFVLIALTSDVMCFLFIPLHWLFFAASTYVWVQYVWHTDRGICLSTVSLWLLFVYIEASVRLKELKSLSPSHHLDLCRPFAAHCIGYPVVTLGFGFKSYVSYRMRLRKQREVAKENDFYMDLMQQALPKECLQLPVQPTPVDNNHISSSAVAATAATSSPTAILVANGHQNHSPPQPQSQQQSAVSQNGGLPCRKQGPAADRSSLVKPQPQQQSHPETSKCISEYDAKKQGLEKQELHFEKEYMEQQIITQRKVSNNVNDYDEEADFESGSHKNSFKSCLSACTLSNGSASNSNGNSISTSCSSTPSKWPNASNAPHVILNSSAPSSSNKKRSDKNLGIANNLKESGLTPTSTPSRDDSLHQRLEADVKRLKADLQSSRQTEQELRAQIHSLLNRRAEEERLRNEVQQLQQENEILQNKLQSLQLARQQDKQNLSQLEKKVQEEKKLKAGLESQLKQEMERKKKDQEVKVNAAVSCSAPSRSPAAAGGECTESCRMKRRELENDLKMMKRELKLKEERLQQAERETQSLRQYKDSHTDTEILMSALSAMQEKNAHLEHSLSAETRLKLDLFSALGDTKRQLEISQALMAKKEKETEELKSKVAEVMACMPNAYSIDPGNTLVSSILFNSKFLAHDSAGVNGSSREVPSSDL